MIRERLLAEFTRYTHDGLAEVQVAVGQSEYKSPPSWRHQQTGQHERSLLRCGCGAADSKSGWTKRVPATANNPGVAHMLNVFAAGR